MDAQLRQVAAVADMKARAERYMELIEDKLGMGDVGSIKAVVTHLTSEEVPAVISRRVCMHLSSNMRKMLGGETFEEVAEFALTAMRESSTTFDDSDHTIRRELFEHYKSEHDFGSAARALSGIQMENLATGSDAERSNAIADHYVTVAETYLIEDETVDAENFVNKATTHMGDVTDTHIQLRYKVTHSKVLDANRKFLDAAWNYYQLSQTPATLIKADDLLVLLGKATTCAILGKAGPQRDRILLSIVKDERLPSLEQVDGYATHGQVLTKMYMQQILRKTELRAFEESLMDHQKALTADGLTILQRAVIEHNVAAAAQVYENIRFEELGALLEIDGNRAERMAAKMVSEGRLNGYIDQVDSVLHFQDDKTVLANWDERITELCNTVNKTCEKITEAVPQLGDGEAAAAAAAE